MKEVKTYEMYTIPNVEDIQQCIDIAKRDNCVVKLEWYVPHSGWYDARVKGDDDAEIIYFRCVPKAYGV